MKNRTYLNILLIGIIVLLCGCSKDLGTYDYKEINTVDIATGKISVLYKERLQLEPHIQFSQEINPNSDRYAYEWVAIESNSIYPETKVVIGNSYKLDYPVELLPADYYLFLKVTDKATGVTWSGRYNLVVATPHARGWMLIGENRQGNVELEMINMPEGRDTSVVTGLLAESGLPNLQGPLEAMHTGRYRQTHSTLPRVYLFTTSGDYSLSGKTYKYTPEYDFRKIMFTNIPLKNDEYVTTYLPKVKGIGGDNNQNYDQSAIICSNGHTYYGDLSYGYPNQVNTNSSEMINCIPIYLTDLTQWYGYVVYNKNLKRFIGIRQSFAYGEAFPVDKAGDPFLWNHATLNRTLFFAENCGNGDSFALLKDQDDGEYYLYKMKVQPAAGMWNKLGAFKINRAIATNFDQAKQFAFSCKRTIMFYAVGSTLYAYDYNTNTLTTFNMGNEISMIRFDNQLATSWNDLYIATWNTTTGGKLQKYTLGTNPNVVDLIADPKCSWGGLSRIVNMSWRNSPE